MAKVNPIQLQKHLKGIEYPATKQDLLDRAKANKADEKMYSVLEQLPDKRYERPTEVSEAIKGMEE